MKVIINKTLEFSNVGPVTIKKDSDDVVKMTIIIYDENRSIEDLEEIFSSVTSIVVVRENPEGTEITENYSEYNILSKSPEKRITDHSSATTIVLSKTMPTATA